MKKTLFVLLSVLSMIASHAQIDSSRINQTISLSRLHHTYLIGFMGNIQTADKIKYVNQVKAGYDTTKMTTSVTVITSSAMIADLFFTMSQQPEGWTAEYNAQIKAVLLPQITNPWLLRKLIKTVGDNDAIRDSRIKEAKLFILSLNQ